MKLYKTMNGKFLKFSLVPTSTILDEGGSQGEVKQALLHTVRRWHRRSGDKPPNYMSGTKVIKMLDSWRCCCPRGLA